jgi:hypothetical protein
MNNWFTVKVKYTKQLEDGSFKRVSEPYLISAMTFTEAETRAYEKLAEHIRGEFSVTSCSPTKIEDVFAYDDCDTWYLARVQYMSEEEGMKSKKITKNFIVSALNVNDAYDKLHASLASWLVSYTIPSIKLSPIVAIFPHDTI